MNSILQDQIKEIEGIADVYLNKFISPTVQEELGVLFSNEKEELNTLVFNLSLISKSFFIENAFSIRPLLPFVLIVENIHKIENSIQSFKNYLFFLSTEATEDNVVVKYYNKLIVFLHRINSLLRKIIESS